MSAQAKDREETTRAYSQDRPTKPRIEEMA